jgi:hypothetical protein
MFDVLDFDSTLLLSCLVAAGSSGRLNNYLAHIREVWIAMNENKVICVHKANYIYCNTVFSDST